MVTIAVNEIYEVNSEDTTFFANDYTSSTQFDCIFCPDLKVNCCDLRDCGFGPKHAAAHMLAFEACQDLKTNNLLCPVCDYSVEHREYCSRVYFNDRDLVLHIHSEHGDELAGELSETFRNGAALLTTFQSGFHQLPSVVLSRCDKSISLISCSCGYLTMKLANEEISILQRRLKMHILHHLINMVNKTVDDLFNQICWLIVTLCHGWKIKIRTEQFTVRIVSRKNTIGIFSKLLVKLFGICTPLVVRLLHTMNEILSSCQQEFCVNFNKKEIDVGVGFRGLSSFLERLEFIIGSESGVDLLRKKDLKKRNCRNRVPAELCDNELRIPDQKTQTLGIFVHTGGARVHLKDKNILDSSTSNGLLIPAQEEENEEIEDNHQINVEVSDGNEINLNDLEIKKEVIEDDDISQCPSEGDKEDEEGAVLSLADLNTRKRTDSELTVEVTHSLKRVKKELITPEPICHVEVKNAKPLDFSQFLHNGSTEAPGTIEDLLNAPAEEDEDGTFRCGRFECGHELIRAGNRLQLSFHLACHIWHDNYRLGLSPEHSAQFIKCSCMYKFYTPAGYFLHFIRDHAYPQPESIDGFVTELSRRAIEILQTEYNNAFGDLPLCYSPDVFWPLLGAWLCIVSKLGGKMHDKTRRWKMTIDPGQCRDTFEVGWLKVCELWRNGEEVDLDTQSENGQKIYLGAPFYSVHAEKKLNETEEERKTDLLELIWRYLRAMAIDVLNRRSFVEVVQGYQTTENKQKNVFHSKRHYRLLTDLFKNLHESPLKSAADLEAAAHLVDKTVHEPEKSPSPMAEASNSKEVSAIEKVGEEDYEANLQIGSVTRAVVPAVKPRAVPRVRTKLYKPKPQMKERRRLKDSRLTAMISKVLETALPPPSPPPMSQEKKIKEEVMDKDGDETEFFGFGSSNSSRRKNKTTLKDLFG